MARRVDYRKGRGSKGVHTEDETVPLGKKDRGRRSPPFDQAGAAESARARPAGQGKHAAGHEGQKSGRKKLAKVRMRRLSTPTPVSGDGPELYDKRGFGPLQSWNVLGKSGYRS